MTNGKPPTDKEDQLLTDWAYDLYKKTTGATLETLKLFITLSSTLLSAYLVFYEQINIDSPFLKSIPLLALLTSLFCSLIGILPRNFDIDLNNLASLPKARDEDLAYKNRWLKLSMASLFIAFGWAVCVILWPGGA